MTGADNPIGDSKSPLGMGPRLTIVGYDPRWPGLFEEEKQRMMGTLGSVALAIEHVGSTAVPGLAAKPIIDLMLGVRRLVDAEASVPKLLELGYEYVTRDPIPGRRYFHKGPPGGRTYHLHAARAGASFWERHILFRDWLRTHPEDARAYERLKRELAALFGSDRLGYTNAKTAFIEEAAEKARAAARAL